MKYDDRQIRGVKVFALSTNTMDIAVLPIFNIVMTIQCNAWIDTACFCALFLFDKIMDLTYPSSFNQF